MLPRDDDQKSEMTVYRRPKISYRGSFVRGGGQRTHVGRAYPLTLLLLADLSTLTI